MAKNASSRIGEVAQNVPRTANPAASDSAAGAGVVVGSAAENPDSCAASKRMATASAEGTKSRPKIRDEQHGSAESGPTAKAKIPQPPQKPSRTAQRQPRLLLVDDNKINLRLLETFMKKRGYTGIDKADNGQLAANAFEARSDGCDIIFMGEPLHLVLLHPPNNL